MSRIGCARFPSLSGLVDEALIARIRLLSILKTGVASLIAKLLLAAVVVSVAKASPAVTVVRTSAPIFYTDIGASLTGAYASYQITNTGATDLADVWTTAGNFTGGVVSLAPSETGMVHLGLLPAGQTKTAFFYLAASATTTSTQTHTVTVYSGKPSAGVSLFAADFSFASVNDTIAANANTVSSTTVGPNPPILGGTLTITVVGDSGVMNTPAIMAFTPATAATWRPDAFQLISSSIVLSGGNSGTYTDALYIQPPNSQTTHYVATYTFRATGTTSTTTAVMPVGYISSGAQIKHTSISSISGLAPVQPPTNKVILTSTANPSGLLAGGTTTYSLNVTNSGSTDVDLEDFVDSLPTSPSSASYVAGSSTWDGAAVGDPVIAGSQLTWSGTFRVPANSSRSLVFNALIPSTPGVYVSSAIGHVMSTQIDTTLSTSDNVPATASVGVGVADLVVSSSHTGSFTGGQTGATYNLTVSNVGAIATSGTVTVTDTLPSGFTATAMSGTGWSCTLGSLTCTRSDALANGSSYPAVTLTINVAADTTGTLTNTVAVTAGGNTNTSTDATIVNGVANLTISSTHTGNFTEGQAAATYTLTISNTGTAASSGTVTVTDTLPSGFTATAMSGTGWNCTLGSLTCTRSDALANGSSYPALTLTMNVAANATGTLTNTVAVTAGGNTNTSTDATIVASSFGPVTRLPSSAVRQSGAPTLVGFPGITGTPVSYRLAYGIDFAVDLTTCTAGVNAGTCLVTFTPSHPGMRRDALLALDSNGNIIGTEFIVAIGQGPLTQAAPGVMSTDDTSSLGTIHSNGSALDPEGSLYITDRNGPIYKLTSTGTASRVSISGIVPTQPAGIVVDGAGNLYVADTSTGQIIKVASDGTGTALPLNLALQGPTALAMDIDNTLYVADTGNNRILKIALDGTAVPVNTTAPLSSPVDLALDLAGNLYVAQSGSGSIIQITPSAGSSVVASNVSFVNVTALETDPAGDLYVADDDGTGTTVYRIAVNGTATPLSGNGTSVHSGDGGPATAAGLSPVKRLALAPGGVTYILEDSAVRRISSFPALPLTFGNTNVGSVSTLKSVAFFNIGNQVEMMNGLAVTGEFSLDASSTCLAGTVLNSSEGCVAQVAFVPVHGVALTGTLTVTPAVQIPLSGVGVAVPVPPADPIALTPVDFGTVPAGTVSLPISRAFTNNSNQPLTLSSVLMSGSDAADFTITNSCPNVLNAGVNCPISVSFRPSTTGLESVSLQINYIDPGTNQLISASIPLTGTGVAAPSPGRLPASGALRFVPLEPCRVADTRFPDGPLGGPYLTAGVMRNFPVGGDAHCGIPANAEAFAFNITAVAKQPGEAYARAWATGQPRPEASILNTDGHSAKANASIVQAGTDGYVSVSASADMDIVLDITGYFVPDTTQSTFFPLSPCRAVDTREDWGTLGRPALQGHSTRSFVLGNVCGLPANATSYLLNFTVVPHGYLDYVQAWATSGRQPETSVLNSYAETTVANMAIVKPDVNGSISVYSTDDTELVIDVAGYFAPGPDGLSLYTVAPCRSFDTRTTPGVAPFRGKQAIPVDAGSCGLPPSAQSYLFNAAVIPQESGLGYLTLWSDTSERPLFSNLNAVDGVITSNMAVVQASSSAMYAYSTDGTILVLDIYGYFAH